MLIRLSLLLLTCLPLEAQDAPWSTYRGNARRTGNTDNVPGPASAPAVLWAMKSTEHFVASPVPVGDQLLFSSLGAFNTANVFAVAATPKDPAAVRPIWALSKNVIRQPTVSSAAVSDGMIVFGDGMHETSNAALYCFPAVGGPPLWVLPAPGELVHLEGSPAVANGKVYVGGGSAGVICVDLNVVTLDGKEMSVKDVPALQEAHWKKLEAAYAEEKKKDPDFAQPPGEDKRLRPAPKAVWTQGKGRWHVDAPILAAGDKVLAASAFLDKEKLGDRALFCLDAATGKELWKAPLTYNPWSGPTLAGDTVIVTTSSISYDPKRIEGARGEVVALDLATGKEKWKKAIPAGVLGCAAVTTDAVIFTATDGRLRTFAVKDGSRVSIYDAKDSFFAPPAVVGDIAYAADSKGVVHAVNWKTGAAVWTFDLGTDPLKSPGMNYGGVTVHGGKLYLATCNIEGPFARRPTVVVCLGAK